MKRCIRIIKCLPLIIALGMKTVRFYLSYSIPDSYIGNLNIHKISCYLLTNYVLNWIATFFLILQILLFFCPMFSYLWIRVKVKPLSDTFKNKLKGFFIFFAECVLALVFLIPPFYNCLYYDYFSNTDSIHPGKDIELYKMLKNDIDTDNVIELDFESENSYNIGDKEIKVVDAAQHGIFVPKNAMFLPISKYQLYVVSYEKTLYSNNSDMDISQVLVIGKDDYDRIYSFIHMGRPYRIHISFYSDSKFIKDIQYEYMTK